MVKVRATQTGYFNNRRFNEGQVFDIPEDKEKTKFFSERWMVKVKDDAVDQDPEDLIVDPQTASDAVAGNGKAPNIPGTKQAGGPVIPAPSVSPEDVPESNDSVEVNPESEEVI